MLTARWDGCADTLIIGTGLNMEFIDVELFYYFRPRGISVEYMDTVRASARASTAWVVSWAV